MLQYIRQNSNKPLPQIKINRHPLFTYINWSYDKNRHFNTEKLRDILTQYNEHYANVYIRLFNEIPRDVVISFMEQENLNTAVLVDIHLALNQLNIDILSFE